MNVVSDRVVTVMAKYSTDYRTLIRREENVSEKIRKGEVMPEVSLDAMARSVALHGVNLF